MNREIYVVIFEVQVTVFLQIHLGINENNFILSFYFSHILSKIYQRIFKTSPNWLLESSLKL